MSPENVDRKAKKAKKTAMNKAKWAAYKQRKNEEKYSKNVSPSKKFEQRRVMSPKTYKKRMCLREENVGITEYISDTAGFTAVVKSRYSDFHVNEIDSSGQVLQLTDLNIPKRVEPILESEEIDNARNLMTTAIWNDIKALAEVKPKEATASRVIEFDVTDLDKEQRTQIHKVLKHMYKRKINTKTVQEGDDPNGRKLIKISKPGKNTSENREPWPFPGDFVHFLVYKENWDTSEIASLIAARLRVPPSQVNYCGIKDKRGKTTQKFCVKKRQPNHIARITKVKNVQVGNFEFSNKVLKLGDLKGNRFRIALRHVNGDEKEIEKSLISLRDNGFINYFGLQRFGNCSSVPTYEIGVALLKADYKTAAELILKPRENENSFMVPIRQQWWTDRNSAVAADKIRNDHSIEKKLWDGLARFGENDYGTALRRIPRNMLLLYPHAFQSLIFNRIVSRRIKEFGLDLMVGDLVYCNKEEIDDNIDLAFHEEEKVEIDYLKKEMEEEHYDSNGEKIEIVDSKKEVEEEHNDDNEEKVEIADLKKEGVEHNDNNQEKVKIVDLKKEMEEDHNDNNDLEKIDDDCGSKEEKSVKIKGTTEQTVEKSAFKAKVKALTAEDIASGKYTPFDVVLPLPGYDVSYPENILSTWYEELLQEYELTSEQLRHNVRTFALAGAYRKFLIKPTNFSWLFRTYDTHDRTLIASDVDMLKDNKQIDPEIHSGNFKALILDFCLPSSVYATMLLRELLKSDTSAEHQSELEQKEMEKVGTSVEIMEKKPTKRSLSEKEDEDQVAEKKLNIDEKAAESDSVALE